MVLHNEYISKIMKIFTNHRRISSSAAAAAFFIHHNAKNLPEFLIWFSISPDNDCPASERRLFSLEFYSDSRRRRRRRRIMILSRSRETVGLISEENENRVFNFRRTKKRGFFNYSLALNL